MVRTILIAAVALMGATAPASAQAAPEPSAGAPAVQHRRLSGPRFGFTVFTGDVAKARQSAGLESVMTQFGWQLETQISTPTTNSQALMEWVFLVGGMEQSELNLTGSWLMGWRTGDGLELGAGPSASYNKDSEKITTSVVIAVGAAAPFGAFRVPLHAAVAMAEGGPRITTLVGWIIG